MLSGLNIIEDDRMVDIVEDWSRVRSPSRAARRRKQGHRQNVVVSSIPSRRVLFHNNGVEMIMHPALADELRRHVAKQRDDSLLHALTYGERERR